MNTTNIFVELVVVGFHTLIWIGLIVLALVGYRNLDVEKLLTVNLALPILAMAYILGILIDRVSDSVFLPQDLKMRPIDKQADLPSFLTMRYYILHKSSDIYAQLEYTRSRLRIARASVFNFALTTIASLLFVWFQLGQFFSTPNLIVAGVITFVIGAILTFASYQSWMGLVKSYSISTIRAYMLLRDEEAKSEAKDKIEKNRLSRLTARSSRTRFARPH
jgi:hypothetical protein